MQIEDITKDAISKTSDHELYSLKSRAGQLYIKHFIKGSHFDMTVDELLDRYRLIFHELKKRGRSFTTTQIDKALFRKVKAEREAVSKPETTEDYHRIPVRECKITATIDIDADNGIKALYCGGEKAIATYLFDTAKWTMDDAEEWVDEHKEAGIGKAKGGATPHVALALMPEGERWNPGGVPDSKLIEAVLGRDPAGGDWTAQMNENAKKVHCWWDGEGGKIAAFKLKIARRDPITDKGAPLKYNWRQTANRMGVLLGARGGVDIPAEDRQAVYNRLVKVYRMFDKEPPEFKKYDDSELEKMFPIEEFQKFVPVFDISKGEDEHICAGIVYEPNTTDAQGDSATEEEIRKACYDFMENAQKFKINHEGKAAKVRVLENYIAPQKFSLGGNEIRKGSWVLITRVLDADLWNAIKKGEKTGYSMAGTAVRS